ncbi:MAG: helix-turn-helix domain-containing protein [Acidobacteriia bacterium]|mgnify:CR=1 FL=1|jgi:transcriptional regulator with XRE-family HTH domain|nr:helix-turn-helix domain-containing protein [Terriglobia bacterium]
MDPGAQLRRVRERLGLTFRDVERASYELASQRGQMEFVVRISRLADIENRGVVPSLHKLYSLCAIYHLDPRQVCRWYNIPLDDSFHDGAQVTAPRTHLAAPPMLLKLPLRFAPTFDPNRTALLSRLVERWGQLEATLFNGHPHYTYGYIGLSDRWMEPLIRPGGLVLVDTRLRQVHNSGWQNEYERPIYFVELRKEYRCSWCRKEEGRLILESHPLSPCTPQVWKSPEEAEIVGQVVGIAMRLVAR